MWGNTAKKEWSGWCKVGKPNASTPTILPSNQGDKGKKIE
jgi:hypothetical protein